MPSGQTTVLLAICLACPAAPSAAEPSYPVKPVRLLVGFPPGGNNDIVARIVTPKLSELLGQQVVIDNRPGATGVVAAGLVARALPDGYTLLAGAVSTNAIAGSLFSKLPYDQERDFAPVTLMASMPHIVSVSPSSDVKSLKDLIAYAKAHPGDLRFASSGNASTPHIAGEMFKMMTGTDLMHVPYKGAAQALPDLLSGQIPVSFNAAAVVVTYIKAGKLRPLAVTALARFAPLPDVFTSAEAGLPGFEMSTWHGVLAPAGTPRSIVLRLHGEIARVLRLPEVREKLSAGVGSDDTVTHTPEQFATLIRSDTVRYAKVVKTVGMRID